MSTIEFQAQRRRQVNGALGLIHDVLTDRGHVPQPAQQDRDGRPVWEQFCRNCGAGVRVLIPVEVDTIEVIRDTATVEACPSRPYTLAVAVERNGDVILTDRGEQL